jgi:hypothetical protein
MLIIICMKIKLNDPLKCGGQIPCTLEDRERFKELAARKRMTMVKLFHIVVEGLMKDGGR